jgi:hypothetical protein
MFILVLQVRRYTVAATKLSMACGKHLLVVIALYQQMVRALATIGHQKLHQTHVIIMSTPSTQILDHVILLIMQYGAV